MKFLKIALVRLIKLLNWFGSGAAIRLVKWTGKASQPMHPKHLVKESPIYASYFERNDVVLDIGCHNGQRAFKLAPYVRRIVAFDYDERALAQAKAWGKQKEIQNIEFLKLSAEEPLPFPDNAFDKVLFLDVLEHLWNRELIMKECFRILKPGGKMILAVPNKDTSWKKFQQSIGVNYFSDPDHKIEYAKGEILAEQKTVVLIVLEIRPIVYDFPLVGVLDFLGGISSSLYNRASRWKRQKALEHPEESIGFFIVSQKEHV